MSLFLDSLFPVYFNFMFEFRFLPKTAPSGFWRKRRVKMVVEEGEILETHDKVMVEDGCWGTMLLISWNVGGCCCCHKQP
ncbi:hypothetical protein K1719_041525 [Acacia pycnantha]|nr:hypothetical protein K1719_041525 [Acacia pycnantha]